MALKIALAATGLLCLLLLAVLVVILTAGQVSFGPPAEPKREPARAQTVHPHEDLRQFTDTKSQFIDDLVEALRVREADLDRREDEVAANEERVRLRQTVFDDMKAELTRLKEEIEVHQMRLEEDVMALMTEDRTSRANVQRIAEMCARMDSESAMEMLREMDARVVAMILTMLDERPAARILDAAAQSGPDGPALAGRWARAIQEMEEN